MKCFIPHQKKAGVVGNLSPLMKIESQRVASFHSFEPRCKLRSEHSQRTVCPIDMKPDILTFAQIRKAIEIIDRSGVGRSRGPDDQERDVARATIPFDRHLEGVEADPMTTIGRNPPQRIAPNT